MIDYSMISVISRIIASILILTIGIMGARYLERQLLSLTRKPTSSIWQNYIKLLKYTIYVLTAIIALIILTKIYPAVYFIYLIILVFIIAFFDIIRNWGTGFYFRVLGHLKVGDEVEINGTEGTVIEISDYGITLMTPSKEIVFVPNIHLASNPVKKRTAGYSTIFKIKVLIPIEKDEISVLHDINNAVLELRGEFVADPRVYKEEEKSGYSIYTIEYELLNVRKNSYIVEKLQKLLKNKIGDFIKIES